MDSKKIFIDTDTEISFILEDILKSENDRVCLVVPDRASIFNSIATLKLMKRVIDKSSKLLVLVTLDPFGAKLAEKVGIKTLSRIGELNENVWQEVQKSKLELIKSKSKQFKQASNTVTLNNNVDDSNLITSTGSENNQIEINGIISTETNKVFLDIDLNEIEYTSQNDQPDISFKLDDNDSADNRLNVSVNNQILFFKGVDVLLDALKDEKDSYKT